jgi:hypothetical protein
VPLFQYPLSIEVPSQPGGHGTLVARRAWYQHALEPRRPGHLGGLVPGAAQDQGALVPTMPRSQAGRATLLPSHRTGLGTKGIQPGWSLDTRADTPAWDQGALVPWRWRNQGARSALEPRFAGFWVPSELDRWRPRRLGTLVSWCLGTLRAGNPGIELPCDQGSWVSSDRGIKGAGDQGGLEPGNVGAKVCRSHGTDSTRNQGGADITNGRPGFGRGELLATGVNALAMRRRGRGG